MLYQNAWYIGLKVNGWIILIIKQVMKIRAFCKSWVVSVQKLVFLATIAFPKAMETYNSSIIVLNFLK